ncbi:MAG: tetratricopeptide repeat protein [Campylobacterota bacterium]
MHKYIYLLLPLLLSANEPSAFDAGNLDIENPYGLTQSEKQILQNKKNLADVNDRLDDMDVKLNSLQRSIQKQSEQIEGLVSVVEGVNQGNFEKLSSLEKEVSSVEQNNTALHRQLQTAQSNQESLQKSAQQLKGAVVEINDILATINKEYVDKERFRKLEQAFFELEKAAASETVEDFGGDNWATYEQMKKLFDEGKLDEAQKRAQYLVKENYKKATANFYLGQVYYAKKEYEDAVYYYKESWSIYDGSEFMPTLLLKTAQALHKLGRDSEAKNFFTAVLDKYPESDEAKQANQQVKEL